jgi:hypothetical protein
MINTDVESMYDYIPIGTKVWIGTDGKLAEFGISQYYTITETTPSAENSSSAEEQGGAEEPSAVPAGLETTANNIDRATPIILSEGYLLTE